MTFWSWDGSAQSEYVHRTVPGLQGPRVNLTYRWVTQHAASCPLAGVVGCVLPTCAQGENSLEWRRVRRNKRFKIRKWREDCKAIIFSLFGEYNLQRLQRKQEESTEEEEMKQQQRMAIMKDLIKKIRSKGRMDHKNRWCVAELLAKDCEKAWTHTGWEDTMQKFYEWLENMKRKDEKEKMEEMHQRKCRSSALHKITKPTMWRERVQSLKEEEEGLLDRCEAKKNNGQSIGNVMRNYRIRITVWTFFLGLQKDYLFSFLFLEGSSMDVSYWEGQASRVWSTIFYPRSSVG